MSTHERRRLTAALQVVVAASLLPRPDQPGSWAVPALEDSPAAAAAAAAAASAAAAAVKAAAPYADALGMATSAASVKSALKDKLCELLAVAPEDIPVSVWLCIAGLLACCDMTCCA